VLPTLETGEKIVGPTDGEADRNVEGTAAADAILAHLRTVRARANPGREGCLVGWGYFLRRVPWALCARKYFGFDLPVPATASYVWSFIRPRVNPNDSAGGLPRAAF